MRIVQLKADNFKRLVAVEITPGGDVVEVTGKNGSGKSSVLDAIYVALVGRSAAPPRPIRQGEEECHINLDLGDLVVSRKFTARDGGTYTDTLKVESAQGLRYPQPQAVLDALLGEIGFDPFEFVQMKAADQADTLLRMVPLPVDLDQMAELDQSDYLKRRDVNRDLAAAKANRDAIPVEKVQDDLPDRQALVEQLGNAANTNAAVERERMERDNIRSRITSGYERVKQLREQAARITAEADTLETDTQQADNELGERPPLAELVDTGVIREQLILADQVLASVDRQKRRGELTKQVEALTAESEKLTEAMAAREKARQAALAGAKMPIEGLGFDVDEKGKAVVTFGGVPFEQASTAEQLRASTAIAMAANPELRVLRVKDGSLLDEDSMRLLANMASEQDFQLWIERVDSGGVGVVMENGEVKAAAKPKAEKPAKVEKPEGSLV